MPPYTIPQEDSDLWDCGVNLSLRPKKEPRRWTEEQHARHRARLARRAAEAAWQAEQNQRMARAEETRQLLVKHQAAQIVEQRRIKGPLPTD